MYIVISYFPTLSKLFLFLLLPKGVDLQSDYRYTLKRELFFYFTWGLQCWKIYLHVNIGDSNSCTNLSISVRNSTLTSRSPLGGVKVDQ